jgi:hypothetical protein
MSAGKGYCRQDLRRHTLSAGKALYRRTVRRCSGVLPSDNPLAILCHGVVTIYTIASFFRSHMHVHATVPVVLPRSSASCDRPAVLSALARSIWSGRPVSSGAVPTTVAFSLSLISSVELNSSYACVGRGTLIYILTWLQTRLLRTGR